MKKIQALVVAAAAALLMSACGSAEPDAVPISEYSGSEQNKDDLAEAYGYERGAAFESEPEPMSESVGGMSDEEIADLALEMIWDSLSYSEQDDICFGWSLDKDMMLDAFMDGADGAIAESQARAFFNAKC